MHSRDAVDDLLSRHCLSVPNETRLMLADLILRKRRKPREEEQVLDPSKEHHKKPKETRSPNPGLDRAAIHARKLLKYMSKPPRDLSSVPNRCCKLRTSIGGLAGMEIMLFQLKEGEKFNYAELCKSLEEHRPAVDSLAALLDTLAHIPRGDWENVGRPKGPAWEVFRTGFIVWERGGRPASFEWKDEEDTLKGAFPDFLRDLLSCCGVEEMKESALKAAVIDCKKSMT